MTSLCRGLSSLDAGDLELAGGKGANLGELRGAGFNVADGFVVTTDAYRQAVADRHTPTGQRQHPISLPTQVRAEVLSAYGQLGAGQVAVRSSATAEDLPGAAFAGQQDTFLGVLGEEHLLEAIRCCWTSLWTERAISDRARIGINSTDVAIAVVVQRMVPADRAGVLFTADPITGARDRVVIDSDPGLGEAVVSGLVTPDHAIVDAAVQVIEHRDGQRETVIRALASGGTETLVGADAVAHGSPFAAADFAALARIGRGIAEHFGGPQDIEWAVSAGKIAILQARPMTALPPAPISLSRVQRFFGPIVLELLPRRPYPMELSAWMLPTVGALVEQMLAGLAGARVSLTDTVPAQDGVVQSFVPPRPAHPYSAPALPIPHQAKRQRLATRSTAPPIPRRGDCAGSHGRRLGSVGRFGRDSYPGRALG